MFQQQSAEDVSQFDSKFTSQPPVDSPDDSTLSESANQVFLVSELAHDFTVLLFSYCQIVGATVHPIHRPLFAGIYLCCSICIGKYKGEVLI